MKRIYDVVNPSDPCTIMAEGDTKEICDGIATAVAILIGSGQYGAKNEEGEVEGLFIFSKNPDAAADAHFTEKHGLALMPFIESNALKIAECLESAVCVNPREYK